MRYPFPEEQSRVTHKPKSPLRRTSQPKATGAQSTAGKPGVRQIQYEVAIIGSGTAGLCAYHAAKAAGVSAVVIESGPYGTTCVRSGCMPSKLMIAAADAAHAVRTAGQFGIETSSPIIDGRKVMDRIRRERNHFLDLVMRDIENIPPADRLLGHARFINDHTLEVGGHTRVAAHSIVIATGSYAVTSEMFEGLGNRLLVNDDIFNWPQLPESLAVIGPGMMGLEFGQSLHRLGVRVAVLGQGIGIGPLSDPHIGAYTTKLFGEEFTLNPNAQIRDIKHTSHGISISYTAPNGARETGQFDYVLAAMGRAPNVHNIGIEHTSVKIDSAGIPEFDPYTTQAASDSKDSCIFIAGDASHFLPKLHEATDEGRIAGENAARGAQGLPMLPGHRRTPLNIVFTDPQIAIVGKGFSSLKPGTFAVGHANFEEQGRSRIIGKNKGLMAVYGELMGGRILGAEILAPAAEHLAHLLAWAVQKGMTVAQMLEMPFYHPVVEEGLRTSLRDLDGQLRSAQSCIAGVSS